MQTAQTTPARGNARKGASPVEPSTVEASTAAPSTNTEHPSFLTDEIARRAYEIYLARGAEDGHDIEDWIAAEREILDTADGSAGYPE
jgi:hypothetical protein